jgi:hypothetical protein
VSPGWLRAQGLTDWHRVTGREPDGTFLMACGVRFADVAGLFRSEHPAQHRCRGCC